MMKSLFDAEVERQFGKVEYVTDFKPSFDGITYDDERDGGRLHWQLNEIRRLTLERAEWWTLAELSNWTGYPQASVSARLRDLRKAKFGGYNVERKYVERGLWAYRVTR